VDVSSEPQACPRCPDHRKEIEPGRVQRIRNELHRLSVHLKPAHPQQHCAESFRYLTGRDAAGVSATLQPMVQANLAAGVGVIVTSRRQPQAAEWPHCAPALHARPKVHAEA